MFLKIKLITKLILEKLSLIFLQLKMVLQKMVDSLTFPVDGFLVVPLFPPELFDEACILVEESTARLILKGSTVKLKSQGECEVNIQTIGDHLVIQSKGLKTESE